MAIRVIADLIDSLLTGLWITSFIPATMHLLGTPDWSSAVTPMITVTSQSENKHDRYGLQREGGRAGGRGHADRKMKESRI